MQSRTAWPMQDQADFLPWLKDMFKNGVAMKNVNDNGGDAQRALFPQQQFVRDYLQHESPYRGLLLLHSLGVGKTCAAIAAAEALRALRPGGKIFVMTTRMLHGNFTAEVPPCTRPDLMRRQMWTFLALQDSQGAADAEERIHAFPNAKMLKEHGGLWVASSSVQRVQNSMEYEALSPTEQAQVDAQIDAQIDAAYEFVHYNGLSRERIARMCQGDQNPFNGSIVIIDEVHNFISRVMNKRLIVPLYERLLDAIDCKMILLSGTPIVNRIAELAYIVNLIQGRTLVHQIRFKTDGVTHAAILEALEKHMSVLHGLSYDVGNKLLSVTFLPVGFVKQEGTTARVVRTTSETAGTISTLVASLKHHGLAVASHRTYAALPLPDDADEFDAKFVDWEQGRILNPVLLQRRILGAISAYSKQDPAYFASVSPMTIVHANMSGLQFLKYSQLRHEERRRERNVQRLQARAKFSPVGGDDSLGKVYRTFSLALCTFVFPDELPRPFKFQLRQRLQEEGAAGEDLEGLDQMYDAALESATKRLKVEMPECLALDGKLAMHSPKFKSIQENLQMCPGTALIYSQFRRAEGLGLLSASMDVNGWQELRLVRSGDGAWVVPKEVQRTSTSGVDADKPRNRYIMLRTEEDPEANRLLLNIFNNELDELPRVTRESLPGGGSNLRGDIVKSIMITASGAEGISLKNVRQVHMVEGFWNHNRLAQVVGRAVRAHSHRELPPEDRRVDVFLYIANFTDQQRQDHAIMHLDKGLTSDQYIHAVAMKKKHLTDQALLLIQAAAVDCAIHADTQEQEAACFHPPVQQQLQPIRTVAFEDDLDDAAYARRLRKLSVVSVDGKKYYLDAASGTLYGYDELKTSNQLVKVGQI